MNKVELKSVIKQLVRESLTEIFAEMNLQTIVEQSVKKNLSNITQNTPTIREQVYEQKPKVSVDKRKKMMESMGVTDDVWRSIYADTASSANPIIEGNDMPNNPEIPASVLEETGLLKDYSKFLSPSVQNGESDEWKQLREQRQVLLNQSVKRT